MFALKIESHILLRACRQKRTYIPATVTKPMIVTTPPSKASTIISVKIPPPTEGFQRNLWFMAWCENEKPPSTQHRGAKGHVSNSLKQQSNIITTGSLCCNMHQKLKLNSLQYVFFASWPVYQGGPLLFCLAQNVCQRKVNNALHHYRYWIIQ